MRIQARLSAVLLVAGLAACSSPDDDPRAVPTSPEASPSSTSTRPPTPTEPPPLGPADLDPRTAWRTVVHLAGQIGARPATGKAYRRAVAWLERELRHAGYDVARQRFPVPGGVSWGVPVEAGTSVNLIATPAGFDSREPHLIVGAHLDTVPQAPGAEDDASGIGVLLAAAQATAGSRARLPVAFIAFGAEEPRGPSDADHHYGSRAYVATLGPRERDSVRGMLALDRVGVGDVVPVCSAGQTPDPTQRSALRAASRAQVPAISCTNRSSDHWSFVRAGLPAARIGGTSYAGYHSAGDVPAVVDRSQLKRTGRLVLAWLAPS